MAGDTISFARGAPSADILPREAVAKAAAVALAEDWERALSYGTGIGHPALAEWIAERHGDLEASQVMIANGSLEGGAMLFEHLVGPGDRVDRRAADLRPHPAAPAAARRRAGAGSARGRRRRPRRLRSGAGGRPGQARPHHSQLPQPRRLHALGREAGAAGRARRRARLLDLRGRPLPRAAVRGPHDGADDLDRQGRPRDLRLVILEDCQPGVRVGYLAGPAGEIAKLAKRANETYISPNMLAEAVVFELCRSGGLDRNIEFVKGALRDRRDALVRPFASRSPRPSSSSPAAAIFSGSTSRPGPIPRRCWPRRRLRTCPSSPAPTS